MGVRRQSVKPARESTPLHYLVAAAATFGALGLRMVLDAVLRDQGAYLTFFLAVVVASRFGATRPGVVATALSALAIDWFFIEPRDSFAITSAKVAVSLALFCAAGTIISIVVGRLEAPLWARRRD